MLLCTIALLFAQLFTVFLTTAVGIFLHLLNQSMSRRFKPFVNQNISVNKSGIFGFLSQTGPYTPHLTPHKLLRRINNNSTQTFKSMRKKPAYTHITGATFKVTNPVVYICSNQTIGGNII